MVLPGLWRNHLRNRGSTHLCYRSSHQLSSTEKCAFNYPLHTMAIQNDKGLSLLIFIRYVPPYMNYSSRAIQISLGLLNIYREYAHLSKLCMYENLLLTKACLLWILVLEQLFPCYCNTVELTILGHWYIFFSILSFCSGTRFWSETEIHS